MPLDRARIRAVLFDVDGTLRDTDDEIVARLTLLLRPFQRALPQGDAQRSARRLVMGLERPTQRCLQALDWSGADRPVHSLATRLGGLRRRRSTEPIPGVIEMLHELRASYPLAIVSAGPHAAVDRFLGEHGLGDLFSAVVTGLTCRRTKPHAEPVEWAARALGLAARECVLVGDTTVDMHSAARAGAQSVGVLCGFGERVELERAGADAILVSTSGLVGLLHEPVAIV